MGTVAIVHVWYPELWPELADCLRNLREPFDLCATCRDDATAARVRADFPFARIVPCENRGFDVWPFLKVWNGIEPGAYSRVLKLHTKRDFPEGVRMNGLPFSGRRWRDYLLSFVRTPEAWQAACARLAHDPKCGMVADPRCVFARGDVPQQDMFAPFDDALRCCRERLGLDPGRAPLYVGGTMFLARADVLAPLRGRFAADDFEETVRDDTPRFAHVMERVFGCCVSAAGLRIDGAQESVPAYRRRLALRRAAGAVGRFFYRDKRSGGKRVIKILKVPVYRHVEEV